MHTSNAVYMSTRVFVQAVAELREIYESRFPALARAEDRLRSILERIVATIEDKTLVRAEVRCVRIKQLPNLKRKALANGWTADEALTRCGDLVGGRVVCNNVEDVRRFAELLKDDLPSAWGNFTVQDYLNAPNEGGYRALHVNFWLDVGDHPLSSDLVPCEVQIRSRLQDSWAELSHDDIYKQPDLPEDLRARARDLSEVLAAADRIASDIRLRVRQSIDPSQDHPDLSRVSEGGLALVFKDVFGRAPPDYVVRQGLNVCDELGVTSLERLPEVLGRGDFRDKLADAYRSIIGVPIGIEDIFLAALYAVADEVPKAISWIRRKARRERSELEQFARREALSSLPGTIDELIEDLEDPRGEADIEGWVETLGATNDCAICSATVIDPYSFGEAAIDNYELTDAEADDACERIERALRASGVETGGWGDGSLCAYHNEQAARDD